jgi:hypothetical protein
MVILMAKRKAIELESFDTSDKKLVWKSSSEDIVAGSTIINEILDEFSKIGSEMVKEKFSQFVAEKKLKIASSNFLCEVME